MNDQIPAATNTNLVTGGNMNFWKTNAHYGTKGLPKPLPLPIALPALILIGPCAWGFAILLNHLH